MSQLITKGLLSPKIITSGYSSRYIDYQIVRLQSYILTHINLMATIIQKKILKSYILIKSTLKSRIE